MMPVVPFNFFLYQIEAGKNGVGRKQEIDRERKTETD
jgi:hypothetical protein